MKKKLYYTVEKDTYDNDTLNGLKTISVYSMQNNEPKKEFELEADLTDNSAEKIQEYLDDNGMGDDEFELIWL